MQGTVEQCNPQSTGKMVPVGITSGLPLRLRMAQKWREYGSGIWWLIPRAASSMGPGKRGCGARGGVVAHSIKDPACGLGEWLCWWLFPRGIKEYGPGAWAGGSSGNMVLFLEGMQGAECTVLARGVAWGGRS